MLDGFNRRGKPIRCQIVCTRLEGDSSEHGVILLMEEVSPAPVAAS